MLDLLQRSLTASGPGIPEEKRATSLHSWYGLYCFPDSLFSVAQYLAKTVLASCQRKLLFGLCAASVYTLEGGNNTLHARVWQRDWAYPVHTICIASKATWASSKGNDLLVTVTGRWEHLFQARVDQDQAPQHVPFFLMEELGAASMPSSAMVGPHHHSLCSWLFQSVFLWGRWSTLGLACVMHNSFRWIFWLGLSKVTKTWRCGETAHTQLLQWGASCFMSWAMWIYLVLSVLPGPPAHTVQPTFISPGRVSFYSHLLHQQHLLHLEVNGKSKESPFNFFKMHGYLKNDMKSNFLKCFLRARCPWDLQRTFPNAESKCRSALFHSDIEIWEWTVVFSVN